MCEMPVLFLAQLPLNSTVADI